MARNNNNIFTEGHTGAIGKQLVLKEINGKTFACKYPDMSQVKYNKKQVGYQNLFSQAVEHARSVMNDPEQVAAYEKKIHNDKRKRGTSVYHTALKDFMAQHSQKIPSFVAHLTFQQYQKAFELNERETKAIKYLAGQGTLTNSIYQRITGVSKPTATRDLQKLVSKGLITAPVRGAGAVYVLNPLPADGTK